MARNLVSFFLQKHFLTTSSFIRPLHSPFSEITKDSNFALHFLTNTCGLPLKSAISVSNKFPIDEKNEKNLHSVVNYLKDEGFSQSYISIIIQKVPRVLHSKVGTILKPKVEFLKQSGFVGELLTNILVKEPTILFFSLGSRMKPCFELLRSYIVSDDKIVLATRRYSWLLTMYIKMQPNIEYLVKQGVPSTCIAKILIANPRNLSHKHSRTIYSVNAIKNLGLQPTSPMFVHAFIVMLSLSESTWKKKMEFFQSFGWSEEDVLSAFKRYPKTMSYSEMKMRKTIDFYLNTVKLDMDTLITRTDLLGYAIDNRVRPRYIIFKILQSKKLINGDKAFPSLLKIDDKAFLEKYVVKYKEDVPNLLDIYTAGKSSKACSLSDSLQLSAE